MPTEDVLIVVIGVGLLVFILGFTAWAERKEDHCE
jgi:hypothetical protein